jgi:hypothetical protein
MKKWGSVMGLVILVSWIATTGGLWSPTAASANIMGGPGLPDLTVTKITMVEKCTVAVEVKNLGPGLVPDNVWTVHTPQSAGVYLYRNGNNYGGAAIWLFDPSKNLKNPGGTATFVSNLNVSGTESIKAVVDLWNVVKEANENNNSLGAKLTCGAPTGTCCVAGTYKGIHSDTASATCPTPKTEDFVFVIEQANCGTGVTGKIESMKNGVWTVTHSFKGTITPSEKCCQLEGVATELTTGKAVSIKALLCKTAGKWEVTNGTYQNLGGCGGTFKMQQT